MLGTGSSASTRQPSTVDVYRRHGQKTVLGEIRGRCLAPDCPADLQILAVALYAGPMAEARYRRRQLLATMLLRQGERGDLTRIKGLFAPLPDAEQKRHHQECEAAAKAIVKANWTEILALADALVQHGHVVAPTLESVSTPLR